jgi:hypothetical protein
VVEQVAGVSPPRAAGVLVKWQPCISGQLITSEELAQASIHFKLSSIGPMRGQPSSSSVATNKSVQLSAHTL